MSNTDKPSRNRQFLLAHRPVGEPGPDTWELAEASLHEPADGQVLIRHDYISVDPAMRGWMNAGKSYVPPVEIGAVMRAYAGGEVVASKHPDFAEGDAVTGVLGVQEYSISDGKGLRKVDLSLAEMPVYLSVLGMTGMTAYFGLFDVGEYREGDVVVVSGAAGAVGMIVGQIAKLKGSQVVGIAGGPEKCRYVTEELGFDACIDYKAEDVAQRLGVLCPKGVDLYFDNVGGDILEAVLSRIALHARVVICGAISQYNATKPRGPANYLQLLVQRATMRGMVVFDHAARYHEAAQAMSGWLGEGKLKHREDIVEGLEQFPDALMRLFRGENTGKLLLRVDH